MDEMKKTPTGNGGNNQGGNNGNGSNGAPNGNGRRRHRNRHRGGKGNHQNAQNNQNNQNPQNAANAQTAQSGQSAQAQPPKQNGQSRQNNGQKQGGNHNGNNNGNKNKQPNHNGNNNASKPKQQNQGKEENRKDTYVYVLDGNLYLNLTNKCSNGCDFCVRNERTSYYGNYLWLKHGEPTAEKVIAAINGLGDITRFKEAVFCGFGEPTYKVAEMVAVCDYLHGKGIKTRLNTNGQGNLINKRDIVPELKDKIDLVNVSLNASCAEKYQKICRSQFRDVAFDAIIEFAKLCRRNGVPCRFSIVDCIGEEEVEDCKKLAQSVNIPLLIRDYITES